MTNLMDIDPTKTLATIETAETGAMANWSEQKRNDFTEVYAKRTATAQCLLAMTAAIVTDQALNRHYIGQKHVRKLEKNYPCGKNEFQYAKEAGRDRNELRKIAEDRAKALLKELPPLKTAVEVIDPETAAMIEELEKVTKEGQVWTDKLDELPTEVCLSEHRDILVGEFLDNLEALENRRLKIKKRLAQCSKRARDLDITIAKNLYAGLPGIAEAVVKVLEAHYEKIIALGQLQRRVTEQVKFGDSDAALELLKGFEKDEAEVNDEMKGMMAGALTSLKQKVKEKRASKKKSTKKALKKGGAK